MSSVRRIILMRHSYAEHAAGTGRDHDRRLTVRGEDLARQTAGLLEASGLTVPVIICSTAARTLRTAELLAEEWSVTTQICPTRALYNAPASEYPQAAADILTTDDAQSPQGIALIGHNPGMAELMWKWSGQGFSVSPATAVVLEWKSDCWSELRTAGNMKCITRITEGRVADHE